MDDVQVVVYYFPIILCFNPKTSRYYICLNPLLFF